jgi:hypothetical protein
MKIFGIVLGVAAGLFTAFLLGVPMIELFLGDCFWEQGCEPHEGLKFTGAVLASCLGGLLAGWGAATLFNKLAAKPRQR